MSVIRNSASAKRVGKVGNETYYVSNRQQIVRVAQNDSNYGETASRTLAQQANRVRWANLVNFYKASASWIRKAYETRKGNQSDYNRFMQVNKSISPICLTRDAALNGACVAYPYVISQGSLPSIIHYKMADAWETNIALGSLVITETTTVAQFAEAVIAANSWIVEGMQISFISYQQSVNALGFPVVICAAYEVTLDTTDERVLRNFLPEFCSQKSQVGNLATGNNIYLGVFTYILSQTVGGTTKVSSQVLIDNNADMIEQYSSDYMERTAIASYGTTADSFLDSGSYEAPAKPGVLFITALRIPATGETWRVGDMAIPTESVSGKRVALTLSHSVPEAVIVGKAEVNLAKGPARSELGDLGTDNKSVVFTMPTLPTGDFVRSVAVYIGGDTYSIKYTVPES